MKKLTAIVAAMAISGCTSMDYHIGIPGKPETNEFIARQVYESQKEIDKGVRSTPDNDYVRRPCYAPLWFTWE